jgi:hypothetical protein
MVGIQIDCLDTVCVKSDSKCNCFISELQIKLEKMGHLWMTLKEEEM